jgi:sugar/nucleoside kinase (ribokinase family)
VSDRSGIICAGNWIVDLVHDIDRWPDESTLTRIGAQTRGIGGGAANVISALARLDTGLPLWPMGAVGDDDYGAFILDECRALGLPTAGLKPKAGVATAHTHVMSVSGESRTFFYQGGANDALSADDFPPGTFADSNARLFYVGYLTLLGELDAFADGTTGAAQVLARAQAAGMVTCVDLVSMPHPDFRTIVAAAAPHVDYLIVNEIEAGFATGMEGTDAPALARMAEALLSLGVAKAVVVHCVERVIWADADGSVLAVEVTPFAPNEIASNLGAGDAFCAGLLFGLHEGWPADKAIDLAVQVAATSLKGHTATEAIPPLKDLKGTT